MFKKGKIWSGSIEFIISILDVWVLKYLRNLPGNISSGQLEVWVWNLAVTNFSVVRLRRLTEVMITDKIAWDKYTE